MGNKRLRMWSGSAGKYFYDSSNVLECFLQQETGLYDHESDGSVFELATGRIDDKGRRIYEGDIVSCEASRGGVAWMLDGEVIYSTDLAAYAVSGLEDGQRVFCPLSCCTGLIVTGNIHENKVPGWYHLSEQEQECK